MLRTHATARLLLGSMIVCVLLAGCAASPAASTSTQSPAATTPLPSAPEATPSANPLSTVDAIVVRPEAIELQDASGTVVQSLDYRSDATQALAVLTELFGEAPVDTEYPGGSHDAPSTAHRWGGFEFWEARYVDQWEGLGEPRSVYMPSFRVRFTSAESAGIVLATAEGFRSGDAWSELVAAPALLTNPSGCSGPYLEFVEESGTTSDGFEFVEKVVVEFRPTSDETSIAYIGAPVLAREAGCA